MGNEQITMVQKQILSLDRYGRETNSVVKKRISYGWQTNVMWERDESTMVIGQMKYGMPTKTMMSKIVKILRLQFRNKENEAFRGWGIDIIDIIDNNRYNRLVSSFLLL